MPPADPAACQRYNEAMTAYRDGDYDRAGSLFAALASAHTPGDSLSRYYAADAHLRVGLGHIRAGRYEAALKVLQVALEFNPHHDSLPRYLAACCVRIGRFDQAVDYTARAAQRQPDAPAADIRHAVAQWRDGQQLAAMATLEDAGDRRPDDPLVWFHLGTMLAARESFTAAIERFERALELRPAYVDARVRLAMCFAAVQDPGQAVIHLTAAQKLEPRNAQIAMWLAMALETEGGGRHGSREEVVCPLTPPAAEPADIAELTRVVLHEPELILAFVALPESQADQDVLPLLRAVLDRAIASAPQRAELYYYLAMIHRRLGNHQRAIASCERAVEIDPRLIQALITLGRLYHETDRQQDAASRLQDVVALGYEYADVYYLLGCVYRDLGDSVQARNSYHRALAINDNYIEARIALEQLAA